MKMNPSPLPVRFVKAGQRPDGVTKDSITDRTYSSENLPSPLFSKEGYFLPLAKRGKKGFIFSV
jgi:hypothetical protein